MKDINKDNNLPTKSNSLPTKPCPLTPTNSKTIEVIEKIEGEAVVEYSFDGDRVDDVKIKFFQSRHIEKILIGKSVNDALVINPRVCGICNHAHLIATVRAIEDCYDSIEVPKNAKILREITLSLELLQNHFKWFYLTIEPLLGFDVQILKATKPSQLISKMIAMLAGQYPHNSYAIPGGVVGALTPLEIVGFKSSLNSLIKIFQESLIDVDLQNFVSCDRIDVMLSKSGDMPRAMQTILDKGYTELGKSNDKFIVFGEGLFKSGKSIKTRVATNIDTKYVESFDIKQSEAKLATYKGKFYEVGPLSRAMLLKTPLIKEAHRKFQDSLFSRILARVCEVPRLLLYTQELIEQIYLNRPFYIEPKILTNGEGVGVVEAARGSLIHKVSVRDGKIEDYQITTPTQWNLSFNTKENPTPVQKALIRSKKSDPLELIFKAFDVCSVCTVK